MSDLIDNSNDVADLLLLASLSKRKPESTIKPCGSCHYCSETVPKGLLYCDSFCKADFEKEEAAKRRNGKA